MREVVGAVTDVWFAGRVIMLSAMAVASLPPVRLALKVDPFAVRRAD